MRGSLPLDSLLETGALPAAPPERKGIEGPGLSGGVECDKIGAFRRLHPASRAER